MSIVCVTALITDRDHANPDAMVLLIESAKEGRGVELPGGKAKLGEDEAVALRREVLEETGLKIRLVGHIDNVPGSPRPGAEFASTVSIWEARALGEPVAGDDAKRAFWATRQDVRELHRHGLLSDLDSRPVLLTWAGISERDERARIEEAARSYEMLSTAVRSVLCLPETATVGEQVAALVPDESAVRAAAEEALRLDRQWADPVDWIFRARKLLHVLARAVLALSQQAAIADRRRDDMRVTLEVARAELASLRARPALTEDRAKREAWLHGIIAAAFAVDYETPPGGMTGTQSRLSAWVEKGVESGYLDPDGGALLFVSPRETPTAPRPALAEEPRIVWRGSASDFATDLRGVMKPEQIARLVEELSPPRPSLTEEEVADLAERIETAGVSGWVLPDGQHALVKGFV